MTKRFCADIDKQEALTSISEDVLTRLSAFSEGVVVKMARVQNRNIGQYPKAQDIVHLAILKTLNAERALCDGDAAITNGRIQLTAEAKADPTCVERYAEGLRFWNPGRHELEGFLRLVILSEIRAWAKRLKTAATRSTSTPIGGGLEAREGSGGAAPSLTEHLPSTAVTPEESLVRDEALLGFIDALDSHELKEIARHILIEGADITDLMHEFGLTRSQVEKRIRKIMETASAVAQAAN